MGEQWQNYSLTLSDECILILSRRMTSRTNVSFTANGSRVNESDAIEGAVACFREKRRKLRN